jgi:uncharacterized protein (TIGR04255 family)
MAQRVRFERPPVVEVVCGVLFGTLPALRTAHVGLFWNLLRTDFPDVDEAPPLVPIVEGQEAPLLEAMGAVIEAPLPRTWFRSVDGHALIQLQRDRFLYNWKRDSPLDGSYPSYDFVIAEFERRWDQFVGFVGQERLGELVPRQFELVYVNIVPRDIIPPGDPVLVDHGRSTQSPRFLPEPESFSWRTSYALPGGQGRFHVAATSVRQQTTGEPAIRAELTARGINDAPKEKMRDWFDLAHEWIVNGFVDVTTRTMQESAWRREH